MKKLVVCITLIMCMAMLAGCGGQVKADSDFLRASDYWWFYDEVTGESEKMSFKDDGTFYWGCECGEPVGDSDLYELYDYDKETQTVKLYNDYDDSSMEMKVLNYSDYHLLLEQDGEIKGYTSEESGLDVANSETYFKDYNMHAWVMDFKDGEVVLGPFDYDGDVEYPDNAMVAYTLAEDAEFYDLQIKKTIEDDGEFVKITHTPLSREEGMKILDGNYGFVWFNEDMEIEKFTYFGEIINWE